MLKLVSLAADPYSPYSARFGSRCHSCPLLGLDDLDVHTHGLEDIVLDPASYPALLFRSRSSD